MTTVSSQIYLSSFSAPVFDQGQEGSCVANAICQAIRLQSREYHQDSGELARNQIYYDYRKTYADVRVDNGASVEKMLSIAKSVGVATQASAAPYGGTETSNNVGTISDTTSPVYQAPTASAYASAASEKVFGYTSFSTWLMYKNGNPATPIDYDMVNFRLNVDQQQTSINGAIDTQLMHGKAVILGGEVPNWLLSMPPAPMATLSEQDNYQWDNSGYGRHAFLIVGRDDQLNGGSYILENSWGTGAGDHGYYAIPYNFLSHGFNISEIAVVDGFKNVDTAWTKERGDMSGLYVALLGRGADHGGLEFWASAEKNGVTLSQIANEIAGSSESAQKYGALSNADYVNQVYTNMTGHAAASSVQSNWTSQLNYGAGRGDVAFGIMNSLLGSTGADHDTLVNRANVSENIALTYQLDNLAEASRAITSVTSNADSVQIALSGVQHDMGWLGWQTTYGFGVSLA
jgi:hypothetical protein